MSGVRMLHFLNDLWKFIQIRQYYTMALTVSLSLPWRPFVLITCLRAYANYEIYLLKNIVRILILKLNQTSHVQLSDDVLFKSTWESF